MDPRGQEGLEWERLGTGHRMGPQVRPHLEARPLGLGVGRTG